MGETKRHHYVPRSYLKRFSFDGMSLHTMLIPKYTEDGNFSKRPEFKDIAMADVCVGKNFYRINPEKAHQDIDPLVLEKKIFQDSVEPQLKEIIESLDDVAQQVIEKRSRVTEFNITNAQFVAIVRAMFVQYYRTKRTKQHIEEINNIIKTIEKENFDRDGIPYDECKLGLDVPFVHADKTYMNNARFNQFLLKLSNYAMVLGVSENCNFMTSDHPVAIFRYGAKGLDILRVNFSQDEFSIYYPLTPRLILEFHSIKARPQAENLNGKIFLVNRKYEDVVNGYAYINAQEFLFSFKNDFSIVFNPQGNN